MAGYTILIQCFHEGRRKQAVKELHRALKATDAKLELQNNFITWAHRVVKV